MLPPTLHSLFAAFLSMSAIALVACQNPDTTPFDADDADFPTRFDNTPPDNVATPAGIALGRVLFYDTLLSDNGTVSCASCHQAEHGFSDPDRFSEGFDGGLTRRNSMSLINVRYYERGRMFWDERAATLEDQVLMPIFDDVEMGLSEPELIARVQQTPYYDALFVDAFGDDAVSADRIGAALAQFVRSIVSSRSRWDLALAAHGGVQGDFADFTAQENQGKALFFDGPGSCASCHLRGAGGGDSGLENVGQALGALLSGAGQDGRGRGGRDNGNNVDANGLSVFFMNQPRHNGLSIENDDLGEFENTGDEDDIGKFKSPSLRNVALTAPYMHDGRLATLEDVIEHYNAGIVAHDNLDGRLEQGGTPRRLGLDDDEKAALVAFLRTLTDETVATDPRFLDPFADGE